MVSLTERVPPIHTLSPAPKRGANYPAGFCARIRRAQPNRTHHREEVPRELRGCASFALRSRVFFFSEYLSCHELRSTVCVTIWYQRRPLSESSPSPLFSCIRENPNSKFSLISEIFGEITSNFHRLGQITPLSKISRITLYEYGS